MREQRPSQGLVTVPRNSRVHRLACIRESVDFSCDRQRAVQVSFATNARLLLSKQRRLVNPVLLYITVRTSRMHSAIAQTETIPADIIGPLRDSADILKSADPDAAQLRQRFHEDGYIYLRQFFGKDDIMAARRDVFARLAAVDEIAEPAVDGVFTGRSKRTEIESDAGKFWRSVSETWTLRRLSHGRQLHKLMDIVLGEESRVQDYIFLRPAGPGKHTQVHCDAPFFTRTTQSVATAWIALGDVPVRQGGLFVLENSHRFEDIVDSYRGFDVATDTSRKAAREETPVQLARARGSRVLTTDFDAGDIVVFGMFLLHGALDNVSKQNEVRLSCDVRYQLASAACDPRYFGPDPSGTTGASYGELVGAKAMTEAWHQR